MPDLLRRPRSDFVAKFMRCENILTGQALDIISGGTHTKVRVANAEYLIPGAYKDMVSIHVLGSANMHL
jgi:hypothetical protein